MSRQRSDIYFPILEPSEENLTTAAIVRKYLPDLSEPEIETKLARGEIARPSMFRKTNKQIEFSDEETDAKPKHTNKKVTIMENSKEKRDNSAKITQKKPSDLFFTNIRDLNNKIIKGNVERNVGFSEAARKVMKKDKTSLKSQFPTFVSPRKVTMLKETNYKTYFAPPLIEKAKQDVEPAFFAGSKDEYVLPEKLPDELVFIDKDGKEVRASSSQTFTDKVSASDEIGKKGGKRKSVDVENKVPNLGNQGLGSLQEDEEEDLPNLDEDTDSEEESKESISNDGSMTESGVKRKETQTQENGL